MSSDVTTQPTWNRLHVARRVRDIAKSMIRLSTLGRSIFPIRVLPGPGVEEPAVRFKVSEDLRETDSRGSRKALSRDADDGGGHDAGPRCRWRTAPLAPAGRRVPARPPSPCDPRGPARARPGGGGYVRG